MSDSSGGSSAPGWYPDPSGGPQTRWWDGTRWTEHVVAPVEGGRPVEPSNPASVPVQAWWPTQPDDPAPAAAPVEGAQPTQPPRPVPPQPPSRAKSLVIQLVVGVGVFVLMGLVVKGCHALTQRSVRNTVDNLKKGKALAGENEVRLDVCASAGFFHVTTGTSNDASTTRFDYTCRVPQVRRTDASRVAQGEQR